MTLVLTVLLPLATPLATPFTALPAPSPPQEREDPPVPEIALDETVVTATRRWEAAFDLPRSVSIADEETLQRRNEVTALDALDDRVGVWVEKRNGVSSDPVLRGLSGANILALVDGNSLTTLWGEGGYAGDDMYGKIDSEGIERIEVVRGPSSVLYGSNALGGVINFRTRRPPIDFTEGGFLFGGSIKASFYGASDGVLLRGDQYGADDRFRYRVGYSLRDIGDTRGGDDSGLLSPSGADESNFDVNTEFRLSDADTLEVNAQVVNRNNLPKYYRPTQRNDNDRVAGSVRWRTTDTPLGDELSWSVYYQDKKDQREWLDQPKRGEARWQTISSDLQSTTLVAEEHFLTWGLHYNLDRGESPDDEQFTIFTPALGKQKAAPDSDWQNLGIYLQDEWLLNPEWTVTASVRGDWFNYDADGNTFWTNPGSTAPENVAQTEPGDYDKTAVTGGLGVVRHVDENWNVYGSWSRGYRLFPPGFGLRQTGYGVLAPTDGLLDPTTGDQFELGTRIRREWWSASVAGYYSFLSDLQQPVPGSYQGSTGIDLDGSGTIDPDENVFVVDSADGYVTGVEIETAIDLAHFRSELRGWSWLNGFMYNYGSVETDGGDEPLRHTHPMRWLSSLHWEDPDPTTGRWLSIVGDFVDRYDRVSEARLNGDVGYLVDPQDSSSGLIRPFGLPGYSVFHVRGGLLLAEDVELTLGIENILDRKYRSAHSRMDASGRSLNVGLKVSF